MIMKGSSLLELRVARFRKAIIEAELRSTEGNVRYAADNFNMAPENLFRFMRKLGIRSDYGKVKGKSKRRGRVTGREVTNVPCIPSDFEI